MSLHLSPAFAAWRECRADYELHLYSQYLRAEAATSGSLLNAHGQARSIDALTLFMGPERRARAYASPELLEHWESFPRVTFAQYEREWMLNREEALA